MTRMLPFCQSCQSWPQSPQESRTLTCDLIQQKSSEFLFGNLVFFFPLSSNYIRPQKIKVSSIIPCREAGSCLYCYLNDSWICPNLGKYAPQSSKLPTLSLTKQKVWQRGSCISFHVSKFKWWVPKLITGSWLLGGQFIRITKHN